MKNRPAAQETQVQSLGWKDHLEKGRAAHSSIVAGESHGQSSLEGYSSWGHSTAEHDLVTKQENSSASPVPAPTRIASPLDSMP